MHAIGQHERLSLANGLLLVQMFSQADKLRTVSRGMPGVKNKIKIKNRNSNLKIENRMPTHRTNIRIIEYSGPALVSRKHASRVANPDPAVILDKHYLSLQGKLWHYADKRGVFNGLSVIRQHREGK